MQCEPLHGVWAAMPTPWDHAYRIDAGLVRDLVGRYQESGLHGAYTTGTDGEMHILDLDEFRDLISAFGKSANDAGLRVQAGCTACHTEAVIERGRIAQEHGIVRIQVALPSWVPLNDVEMLRFFEALQVALPDVQIVHYNIARAGRFLTGADYRAILEVAPNLIGSKHTGGDIASLIEIVQATPELDHFVVDSQIVPGALFGAKGFYSFLANLSPELTLRLWRLCEQDEWEEAARMRTAADAFFRRWRSITPEVTASPALGKIATKAGIHEGMSLAVRSPYLAGEDRHVDDLKRLIGDEFPELTAGM